MSNLIDAIQCIGQKDYDFVVKLLKTSPYW